MAMNSCNFVGNLVNDPAYFDGEAPRVLFTLAVDHNGKPVDGHKQAEFLDFIAWRSTAEYIAKYCHKGDKLAVQNAMARKRDFVTQNGEHVQKTEFQVESVDIVRRARAKDE